MPTSTTYAGVTPKGNGQYAEVYLGEAFFDINVNSLPTSGTSSSTINIDPVSNANVGLPTTYWIEGGTTHKWQGSSDGSAAMENSSPLSISYVVPATSSGSGIISLSATSATARILASTGTDVVNYAVSNSAGAGASLTAGTAAFTAGGNGSFSPSTTNATGSAAAGNTLFSGSTTYTAGATLGPQNLTISGTGYDGTNTTTATTTVSTDIVAARALTAGTVAMPALLTNGSYTVSLAITGAAGADTSYTRPTASGSFTSGSLTLANTGATETFSTAGTLSNNLNLTFSSATTGTNSVSVPLSNYNGHVLFEEAGVAGANVNAPNTSGSITFSTMVGQATPATQATSASAATFNGNTLKSMVAAGATYANLSSFVTSGSGCLGTAAIFSGSNSGSLATIGMTWRPRATNEIPGSGATRPPVPATAIGQSATWFSRRPLRPVWSFWI